MKKRKNKNKSLIYIWLGLVILLLIIILFISLEKTNKNMIKESDSELNKYRSSEIPEQCRLPEYEKDIESWKQHLSHHEDTLYCLDYYK